MLVERGGNRSLNIDLQMEEERNQRRRKVLCIHSASAGCGSPWHRGTPCGPALRLDGQADPGVNESSIHMALFSLESERTARSPGQ